MHGNIYIIYIEKNVCILLRKSIDLNKISRYNKEILKMEERKEERKQTEASKEKGIM